MTNKMVVLVTCGSAAEGERIARVLVESGLAGCVNLLESPVRSTYRWKGAVETAMEYLLLIKTSRRAFARLQAKVKELHSYEVPEVIALPILEGSRDYLSWLAENLASPRSASKKSKRRGSNRTK
jgi:periplasmic divalent cation tolerance protein